MSSSHGWGDCLCLLAVIAKIELVGWLVVLGLTAL